MKYLFWTSSFFLVYEAYRISNRYWLCFFRSVSCFNFKTKTNKQTNKKQKKTTKPSSLLLFGLWSRSNLYPGKMSMTTALTPPVPRPAPEKMETEVYNNARKNIIENNVLSDNRDNSTTPFSMESNKTSNFPTLTRPDLVNYCPASNLAFNEKIRNWQKAGETVYHFGFGQAPFPVVDCMTRALKEYAAENAYLPVAGGFWLLWQHHQ